MNDPKLTAFLQNKHKLPIRPYASPKQAREHSALDLPRRIYMFWDNGFDVAPDIVKLCAKSWQTHNPGWDVILLDQQDANKIIARDTFPPDMKIAHYADILRTALLADGGGVWADASCLCLRPLDHWLPHIFNQCGFFAFHKPAKDRVISNWFLAAEQDNVIVQEMYALFLEYWEWGPHDNGKPPYFWFHHLFAHLVRSHPDVKIHWSRTPKLSAVPVHQLKRLLSQTVIDDDRLRERIGVSPVQKLTHKQGIAADDVLKLLEEVNIRL